MLLDVASLKVIVLAIRASHTVKRVGKCRQNSARAAQLRKEHAQGAIARLHAQPSQNNYTVSVKERTIASSSKYRHRVIHNPNCNMDSNSNS